MDTEWPFVFLGLAIGVMLGCGGATFFHSRTHDAGSHKHKGQTDASLQPTAKAITPTLSEVQHAYAAEFSFKGALRGQGHEAVTIEKGGPQTPSANKAAPEHVDPPLRQISSYGKFLAWSLEHTPSWELHATKQDILSPTKEHLAPQDLPTDTSLKRTFTSTELAATLSSPDSFDRVAVDYVLDDTDSEQEQGHHERKGQKKKSACRDISTLMPASSLSRTEGRNHPDMYHSRGFFELQTIGSSSLPEAAGHLVWRSSSLDQAPSDAKAGTSMDVAIDSSRETFSIFGAALSAPSMTTTSTSGATQLIDLALDDDMIMIPGVITPLASLITTVNEALWQDTLNQATIAILLKLEEILPRPNEGLLKRMVRLSDVRLLSSIDNDTPTLQLKASAEYRVALQILPSSQWRQNNVRHWVKWVKMDSHGWRAKKMQVLQEGNDQEQVWTGACVWVTDQIIDRIPNSDLHHGDGGARSITMSLGLGKTVAGGVEEEICISVQLHATINAVRGSSVSEYDTALPQNALLNAWKVAPERLFSNTSDIILCKC